MNEVMNLLQKMSTDMSSFVARQNQLEANHEQSFKGLEEAVSEIRDVLNEVIYGGKKPERDKNMSCTGELATPSTTGVNIPMGISRGIVSTVLSPVNEQVQTFLHLQ